MNEVAKAAGAAAAKALLGAFEAISSWGAGFSSGSAEFHRSRLATRAVRAHRDLGQTERWVLDRIAAEYRHDPIEHAAAVGEYFTSRSHRELDELAAKYALRPHREVSVGDLLGRRLNHSNDGTRRGHHDHR